MQAIPFGHPLTESTCHLHTRAERIAGEVFDDDARAYDAEFEHMINRLTLLGLNIVMFAPLPASMTGYFIIGLFAQGQCDICGNIYRSSLHLPTDDPQFPDTHMWLAQIALVFRCCADQHQYTHPYLVWSPLIIGAGPIYVTRLSAENMQLNTPDIEEDAGPDTGAMVIASHTTPVNLATMRLNLLTYGPVQPPWQGIGVMHLSAYVHANPLPINLIPTDDEEGWEGIH